ncbi:LD-carboxypeptidase-domain-containing protein [Mycena maculata]|uniref:LD-carboxypeptidase-domain-containing protein n=1 Tax=Mycena maculata TaxID=230809 RepID=A0AAD7J724_9AGAR|nr:LD-carboxypeptidase-domain-containing protein [Mycena maculata]
MLSPVIPRALVPGGTVAFISPSARLNTVLEPALLRAKTTLKIFWTSEAAQTISESISHRVSELLAAFRDSEVGAILCTIGGNTATELLPSLLRDADVIATLKANPKVFVGYSDITTLHWALAATTGLRTFYGPTALPELGAAPNAMPFTVDNLLRTITKSGTVPLGPLTQSEMYAPALSAYFLGDAASMEPQTLVPTPRRTWLRRGTATGQLFGGCLPVVVRL